MTLEAPTRGFAKNVTRFPETPVRTFLLRETWYYVCARFENPQDLALIYLAFRESGAKRRKFWVFLVGKHEKQCFFKKNLRISAFSAAKYPDFFACGGLNHH